MQSKSLLIAIAAFAVTATGVQAHGGARLLSNAGLDDKQVSALVQAHQLRISGDIEAARDLLVDAGITEDELLKIHRAAKESKKYLNKSEDFKLDNDYAPGRFNQFSVLTDEQRDVLKFAKQTNDKATMQAVLDEAGIELRSERWHH